MMRGTSRWARRVLTVCAATAVLGCDDFGEKQALDIQAETSAMRESGGAGSDQALSKLSAAANASGSGAAVIQAQESLAQVQAAKAETAAVELARAQAEAARTLFKVGQLARQARTSVVLAANYRQLDPRLSVEQIADFTAKARGDGNVETYPVEVAKIPTLSIVQQNKSRLDGEVAKLQEQITAATSERDKLLSDAGKAASAAESQNGAERTAAVKQIADLRGQASQASRKISDLGSALARTQADQAEQAALAAQLQTAVESMSAQGASLTQGWQAMSAKAAEQTALAKRIVDGDGESVRSLTKVLNDQSKEIDTKRGEVEQLYKDSIAQFGKAATNAGARIAELNAAKQASGPAAYEIAAWDHEASLIAVDRVNLDKANAEKALADLYGNHALWLAGVLAVTEDVESVSEALNVGAADPFNGDKLKTDLGKSIDAASEAYDTVIATLDGVNFSSADLAPLKPRKAMARIIALADHATLADLAAANKVSPEVAKKADSFHKDMSAAVEEAKASNTPLPTLPTSLGGAAPAAAHADATATPAAADDPATAEVRSAALKFQQSLASGNVDQVKAVAVVADNAEPEVQVAIDAIAKIVRLRNAMTSKFPNDPTIKAITATMTAEAQTAVQKFRIEGDTAFSNEHVEGEPEDFRKVDGAWKGVISLPVTDAGKAERAKMLSMADGMAKLADELDAGTLTDATTVAQRLETLAGGGPATAPSTEPTTSPAETPAATTPPL